MNTEAEIWDTERQCRLSVRFDEHAWLFGCVGWEGAIAAALAYVMDRYDDNVWRRHWNSLVRALGERADAQRVERDKNR